MLAFFPPPLLHPTIEKKERKRGERKKMGDWNLDSLVEDQRHQNAVLQRRLPVTSEELFSACMSLHAQGLHLQREAPAEEQCAVDVPPWLHAICRVHRSPRPVFVHRGRAAVDISKMVDWTGHSSFTAPLPDPSK